MAEGQPGGNEVESLEKLANAIGAAMPKMETTEHEGTTLLSVEEAFELGRAMSKGSRPTSFGAWNQPGPDNRAARRS